MQPATPHTSSRPEVSHKNQPHMSGSGAQNCPPHVCAPAVRWAADPERSHSHSHVRGGAATRQLRKCHRGAPSPHPATINGAQPARCQAARPHNIDCVLEARSCCGSRVISTHLVGPQRRPVTLIHANPTNCQLCGSEAVVGHHIVQKRAEQRPGRAGSGKSGLGTAPGAIPLPHATAGGAYARCTAVKVPPATPFEDLHGAVKEEVVWPTVKHNFASQRHTFVAGTAAWRLRMASVVEGGQGPRAGGYA